MRSYWLQDVAALDNAPLTVSDAIMQGLLTGAKYRFDACENIRHDRPAFSPKRISYVLPPQASAADSSDVTASQGSSSCAQDSSKLNSDSQVTAMQPTGARARGQGGPCSCNTLGSCCSCCRADCTMCSSCQRQDSKQDRASST